MSPSRLIGVALFLAGAAVYGVEALTPMPAPETLQRTTGRLDSLEQVSGALPGQSLVLVVGGRRFLLRSDSLDAPPLERSLQPGTDTVKVWSTPSRGGTADVWQLMHRADFILSYSTKLAYVRRGRSQMKVLGIVMIAVGLIAASGWSPSPKS